MRKKLKTPPKTPKPGQPHRSTIYRRNQRAKAAASTSPTSTAQAELQAVGLPGASPGGPIHVEPPSAAFDSVPIPEPEAAEPQPDPTDSAAEDDGATDADDDEARDGTPDRSEHTTERSDDGSQTSDTSGTKSASPSGTTPQAASASPHSEDSPNPPSPFSADSASHSSSARGLCHKHRNAPLRCSGENDDGTPCDGFVYPDLDHDDAMRSADALIPTLARAYLRGIEPPPLDDQERHAWGHVFQETRAMYGWPNPGQAAILTAAGLAFTYAGRVQELKNGTRSTSEKTTTRTTTPDQARMQRTQDVHDAALREAEEAKAAHLRAEEARNDERDDAGDEEDGGGDVPEHEGALRRRAA